MCPKADDYKPCLRKVKDCPKNFGGANCPNQHSEYNCQVSTVLEYRQAYNGVFGKRCRLAARRRDRQCANNIFVDLAQVSAKMLIDKHVVVL